MLSTKFRAVRKDHCRPAQTPTRFSLTPRVLLAGGLAIALVACAPATVSSSGTGGSSKGGSGGNSSGGAGSGGSSSSGGAGSGGTSSSGGAGSGGTSSSGGAGSGGTTAKGGSGGTSSGGAGSGGTTNSGGTTTSGGTTGSGGTTTNGGTTGSGGTTNSGGTTTNGGTTGSGGATGNGGSTGGSRPKGYFYTADWSVKSVDWHGCAWTGKDSTVSGSTTSVTPVDFMAIADGGPYEVSGTVYNDYNSVALMGFNLNEAITGVDTQCKNDPASATKDGPPTATIPAGATGIAVNWSAKVAPVTSFRIQIQGVKGGSDATNRWCATITDASGPSFVPFSSFNTKCWDGTGTKYNNEPIDAVVFLVPGTVAKPAPYDFTIVDFAPGTSKTDAPGGVAACGQTTGSVGATTASQDASMMRAAVTGTDCKKYIINNNNWGQPTSTTQVLNYTGSSFTINSCSGSGGGANVVSFPSIYIGANGQIANGTYDTWSDSGLPKQISAMTSGTTSFTWSGGKSGGNYNAAYDIWFAKSSGTVSGSYNDAISGFIMIWLYKPSSSQPIGSSGSTRPATIGGQAFHVWRGGRNATATGTDGTGRPVISYVADSTVQNFSGNLKAFFDDAVANAADDMSKGTPAITQAFANNWYLTDVFAGFEIWNGGDAVGLQGKLLVEIK
jgi:hypothetical protein